MNEPTVSPGEWIKVGSGNQIDGLVMAVFPGGILEVGYVQNTGKVIKDEVAWRDGAWRFVHDGPCGAYLRGVEEKKVRRGPPMT